MKSDEIRRIFTEFFVERGHLAVPSSPLVPHNDPTVLLTTAGMQQMTPYFLGLETPPHHRMTSIQKCFRTVDIDEVGDESHLTFFEMLGNFSVGDYFKAEAIPWAWELLTSVFGVPQERWHATVHLVDDFSFDYWHNVIGLPKDHLRALGDEDNWWGPVGDTGPNGPDSEIYYDLGEQFGCGRLDCGPTCAYCSRFLETWNLVFMEYFKERDGSQRPLPRRNIDTGMGLERIAMILQNKPSVYETDLYYPIVERAAELAGVHYRDSDRIDRSLRVIADHARAVTFLVADGVLPGNEGRGYVLRRILRRAIRHGRLLGLEQAFMVQLVDVVIEMFARHYPDLNSSKQRIALIVAHDEEHFGRTLSAGISRFETLATDLRSRGESTIPGADAFRLYDTYGFPLELTDELAQDEGFSVDRGGFDAAMAVQREHSRATAGKFAGTSAERTSIYASLAEHSVKFAGYETTDLEGAAIVAIIGTSDLTEVAEAGDHAEIILDATPFYAESGGQVGDTGIIRSATGTFRVEDTQRPAQGLVVHRGTVVEGFLQVGTNASATVDRVRRDDIRRNHTATHLLHAALRQVLGEHARQAGSLVSPDRLRFDFTSIESVGDERIELIERIVNEEILANEAVQTTIMDYADAMETGAMALFGEKYGDVVRVVSVPGFSQELCGGTHVQRTGDIGLFFVTAESSVASGIRRIEAVTGHRSLERSLAYKSSTERLARALHVSQEQIVSAVAEQTDRLRTVEREIERLRVDLASARLSGDTHEFETANGIKFIVTRVEAPSRDALLKIGDRLRDQIGSGVIVLGTLLDEQPALIAMVTKDIVPGGFDAGKLIRAIAPIVGGRGGGRAESAQGGGTDVEKLDDALAAARAEIYNLATG
ncbi:MAG TPA: alanine--tRNA ligase [Nitrolancea sp.]|nr:alanine--tRNA ligase [Nitrolancea sp.]